VKSYTHEELMDAVLKGEPITITEELKDDGSIFALGEPRSIGRYTRLTVFNPLRRSREGGTNGAYSPGQGSPVPSRDTQAGGLFPSRRLSDALFDQPVAPEYATRQAKEERRAELYGKLLTMALGAAFIFAVMFCASVVGPL